MHNLPDRGGEWIFVAFAMWGGLANYLATIKRGHRVFSVIELVGELVIAGFSGSLVFALCEHYEVSQWMSVALVGMGGHLGSRTVFLLERQIRSRILSE